MTTPSPHATLLKFGYPGNLIHQGDHWAVLVRPAQVTLGSLVLCSLGPQTSYAELPPAAFAEQGQIVARIEALLRQFSKFERINYLMLMMVDPHVHFHVLPRYEGDRTFEDEAYTDKGWPGLPELTSSLPASKLLVEALKEGWQSLAVDEAIE